MCKWFRARDNPALILAQIGDNYSKDSVMEIGNAEPLDLAAIVKLVHP